jgi:cell division transport system permease protein
VTRLRALVYGVGRALRGSAGRPLVTILSTGAIGVALLLVGLAVLAARNVGAVTGRWDRGVQMIVYLTDGTTPERARAIGAVLGSLHAIERVDYVPPDAAWRRLADSLGSQRRDLLDGVEAGFLPASLEVRLAGGVRSVAAASPVIDKLKHTPGVEEVEFLGDWVDRLTALLGALRFGALLLALLVGGACIYIVAGTIQLGMYARKDELDVLRLVGATDAFIRLPLVVEGALQGTVGAAIGVGLLYGVYRFGAPTLERLLGGAIGAVHLDFLGPTLVAGALGAGLVFGVLGSWLAIGRHAEA